MASRIPLIIIITTTKSLRIMKLIHRNKNSICINNNYNMIKLIHWGKSSSRFDLGRRIRLMLKSNCHQKVDKVGLEK